MRNRNLYGLAMLVPLLMFVGAILNGWALSVLWGWFVAPVFGIPELSILQAIGFGLIVSYMTREPDSSKSKDKDDDSHPVITMMIVTALRPIFAVFIGWIVTLFMQEGYHG